MTYKREECEKSEKSDSLEKSCKIKESTNQSLFYKNLFVDCIWFTYNNTTKCQTDQLNHMYKNINYTEIYTIQQMTKLS